MSERTKNYGKSARDKLLAISKRNHVPYQTLLTRYFQERLLYRITQTRYKESLLLKGGALLFALEKFSARPTLDIDFLGRNISNDGETIKRAFCEICSMNYPKDGVSFDIDHITCEAITEFKDYHGTRVSIPVRMDTISQNISIDIGFGDVITPAPTDLEYPCLLESLDAPHVKAYSIETVVAEKMQAAIDLGYENSRMKDFYDLYKILKEKNYSSDILQEAVANTFLHRHTAHRENVDFFDEDFGKNGRLRTRWAAFTKRIKSNEGLQFEEVIRYLQKALFPYWEALK